MHDLEVSAFLMLYINYLLKVMFVLQYELQYRIDPTMN